MTNPTEPEQDWVAGLAHERLDELTMTHLESAERAARAAEDAKAQARDLATHNDH